MSAIDSTLQERGNRYGSFQGHALITQNMKRAMVNSPNWDKLSDDKKEALEMVAHKIGRILNGDPEYSDSWHDIIGYTRLVEEDLVAKEEGREAKSFTADDLELVPKEEEFSFNNTDISLTGIYKVPRPENLSVNGIQLQ